MEKNYASKLMLWIVLSTSWIALIAAGCGRTPAKTESTQQGLTETGIASYYASRFQHRKTANGERYDSSKLTAAHRTLPFGTLVKVTHIRNKRSVIVRINDRGPFVKGRIIDLSRSAFSRIANPRIGVIDVEIEIVESSQ